MVKKGVSNIDKECPICGGIIWGKGQKVLIEGAKITVCQSCAQYGKKVQDKPKMYEVKKPSYMKQKSPTKKPISRKDNIDGIEVVPDFANRIRKARNANGLNQDQFAQKLNEKPSLIRRIEAGKVEPTIKLAKKIEQVYQIKLLKKMDDIDPSVQSSKYMKKSTGTSLGDIAYIKKKK